MPELRSGVRRGRGRGQKASEPARKEVKARAAPRGRPRTRLAAKELELQEPLIPIPPTPIPEPLIPILEPAKEEKKEVGVGVNMGDESGGLSGNKPEEDATTPPFPDRVCDYDSWLVFFFLSDCASKVSIDLFMKSEKSAYEMF